MEPYVLNMFEPILLGSGFVANLSALGIWRRSIRLMGGYWMGSLTILADIGDLAGPFDRWLGNHVEERTSAGRTWQGLIYEMELAHKGARRRRTLQLMANAVDVMYQDAGEVVSAGFATQAHSISRYGRKEEILSVDNVPEATAQALRARYLAGNAWPWARPVAVSAGAGQDETCLELRACGYVFTAQWMLLQAGDGSKDDIDAWLSAIVGTAEGLSSDHGGATAGAGDCQFLRAGNLASNTLQVKTAVDSDTRPWSKIEELAGLGDSSGDPWRAWVGWDRRLHYEPVQLSPRYYLRDGGLYDTAGGRVSVSPWSLHPGVVRDLGYPVRRSEPGSSLEDARDYLVDEVEVGADGSVSLKTALFEESEMLSAQAALEGQE
jgi:hypothetical protein